MPYRNSCKLVVAIVVCVSAWGTVTIEESTGRIDVSVDGKPFGTYVYEDEAIPRPYWTAVHAPNGTQVTRTHPPLEGSGDTDHETMHPGIWLAFGDISGADFWRNKAQVKHQRFVVDPKLGPDYLIFTVENAYVNGEHLVAREMCRYTLRIDDLGYFLLVESTFFDGQESFAFGDQEEMGLGVRVATPLAVKNGGTLLNSDGAKNEEKVWGKAAAWCDYSGTIDGQALGIAIMPNPANFRASWFHARDYGFFAANPFGQQAMSGGETSTVEVSPGNTLELGFGIYIHSGESSAHDLISNAYSRYLDLIGAPGEE